MAHSFDKYWRRDGAEPKEKKAGKPALPWTPAQDEQLFRLVAKANVPWKHIATAMYEPAVPAGPGRPGRPEFAPW